MGRLNRICSMAVGTTACNPLLCLSDRVKIIVLTMAIGASLIAIPLVFSMGADIRRSDARGYLIKAESYGCVTATVREVAPRRLGHQHLGLADYLADP